MVVEEVKVTNQSQERCLSEEARGSGEPHLSDGSVGPWDKLGTFEYVPSPSQVALHSPVTFGGSITLGKLGHGSH